MGKGIPWNFEDEKLLKDNYLAKNKNELLLLFPNRTWKAIKSKANTFNLKKRDDYEVITEEEKYKTINNIVYKKCKCCREYYPLELKYYPKDKTCPDGFRNICKKCKGENFEVSTVQQWTKEDELLLIKNYSLFTNYELIEKFFPNRKIKHLDDKAFKLGLKKNKETIFRARKNAMTNDVKLKISKMHITKGTFKGVNNPMYGSHRIGELNPNWKGGITTEKETSMRSEEYKNWRKQVFERDNYTCKCCGRMTHDIEAHHLNNFAEYIYERFNTENGETLCKDCHNPNKKGSYHNRYGTFHNTKEQFEEFKKRYYNGEFDNELEEDLKSYNSIKRLKELNIWKDEYLGEVS